jgi:hypothetical protein
MPHDYQEAVMFVANPVHEPMIKEVIIVVKTASVQCAFRVFFGFPNKG